MTPQIEISSCSPTSTILVESPHQRETRADIEAEDAAGPFSRAAFTGRQKTICNKEGDFVTRLLHHCGVYNLFICLFLRSGIIKHSLETLQNPMPPNPYGLYGGNGNGRNNGNIVRGGIERKGARSQHYERNGAAQRNHPWLINERMRGQGIRRPTPA